MDKSNTTVGKLPLFSQKKGRDFLGRGTEGGPHPLVGLRLSKVISSYPSTSSAAPPNDGRVRRGLGRNLAAAQRFLFGREWSLARRPSSSLHELVGTQGDPFVYPGLPSTSPGQVYKSPFRQDSLVLPEKVGVPGFSAPLVPFQGYLSPLQESQNLPHSFTLERSPQCLSGQSIQEGSYSDRMVPRRPIFSFSLPGVGVTQK